MILRKCCGSVRCSLIRNVPPYQQICLSHSYDYSDGRTSRDSSDNYQHGILHKGVSIRTPVQSVRFNSVIKLYLMAWFISSTISMSVLKEYISFTHGYERGGRTPDARASPWNSVERMRSACYQEILYNADNLRNSSRWADHMKFRSSWRCNVLKTVITKHVWTWSLRWTVSMISKSRRCHKIHFGSESHG